MNPQSEVEKRVLDTDSPTSLASKRRKVVAAEIDANEKGKSDGKKVDATELASAFALASLASLRSASSDGSECREEKERHKGSSAADKEVRKAASYEDRSPKTDNAPLSPEQRSLGSSKSREEASSDDELSASRKVHFSPGTKKQSNVVPATPPRRPTLPSGHMAHLPPRSPRTPPVMHHRALVPQPVRHPYATSAFMRHPPLSTQQRLHHPQVSPPSYYRPGWYSGPRIAYPPPQRLMQPPLQHPESQWICDFCNVAAFATYEDACAHEEVCKQSHGFVHRHKGIPPTIRETQSGSFVSHISSCDEDVSTAGSVTMHVEHSSLSSPSHGFTGALCLAMEESDREWLSELNCYIRSHCVEAFSASEEDVSRSSKRGRITINQVGIRCRHCVSVSTKDKAVAAVSFPTSIGGIYESVKRWQRVHVEVCEAIPQEVRNTLAALSNTNVWVPTTRQYWTDSARAIGLVDTHEGIRFSIDPKNMASSRVSAQLHNMARESRPALTVPDAASATKGQAGNTIPVRLGKKNDLVDYIVFPEDMELIPSYVYYLMRQVEPCQFTEADRFVARSKGPVGYPGFQCRHCNGHAGLGKYFPVSSKSLSTNSTSQNIHAHLLKCRKCPEQVKDRLVQLKIEKSRSPRLEPGWRKVFFDKVWGRLHG